MSTTSNAGVAGGGGISAKVLLLGFIAGFIAVPLGHQVMAYIYYLTMPGRAFPWNMGPANAAAFKAFGVPQVVNLSFWGGVWGILWALIEPLMPRGWLKYVIAVFFGGICATAVSAYVVPTLKGNPTGALSLIGFGLNGAWGLVTALLFDLMRKRI